MSRRLSFLVCALPALSAASFASDGRTAGAPAADPANERGVPALFSWADVDGDGRLDLASVSGDGRLQLLVNAGEGRFEDVTERFGLAGIENAALASWADYDADGRLDLFVGARDGASHLFHNEGGAFLDWSAASGLTSEGAVQSAQWLDHDGDGRLDLFVALAERNELYRGVEGGFFERSALPPVGTAGAPTPVGPIAAPSVGTGAPTDLGSSDERNATRISGSVADRTSRGGAGAGGARIPLSPPPTVTSVMPFTSSVGCASSVKDQANPSTCLSASTTPTLGRLYPISANLFVATGGDVGIGTTSPAAKLDVAGTARMTDTLTLSPSGDQALDVSTGSIYKGGALFLHTKGGSFNTALGRDAMSSVTTGFANTANGYAALRSDTTGFANTASGYETLLYNTTGANNTASGFRALEFNTTGELNTASGKEALKLNTTGDSNTASGAYALTSNTTGFGNSADGSGALKANTSGGGNTASGFFTLPKNTTGNFNTSAGANALFYNTTGDLNTAVGFHALFSNTTGHHNTASGSFALSSNTTGYYNTASGYNALKSSTTGRYNTAVGYGALYGNTSGFRNIALGRDAGSSLTTGSDNIDIGNTGVAAEAATTRIGTAGTHTKAFVAGIRGVTTANANAIPVLVDSAGQLGTVSSSRRFKKDIADMGDLTERLLELRPVVFHYKQEQTLPDGSEVPLEYGLIAEEVAEVFPELVVYDEEGKPFTVKYHLLGAMLLNELQKQVARDEEQARELEEQRSTLEEQQSELTRLRGLEARLAAVEARAAPATLPERSH